LYGSGFVKAKLFIVYDISAHVDLKFPFLISDQEFVVAIILQIGKRHQLGKSVNASDIVAPGMDPRRFLLWQSLFFCRLLLHYLILIRCPQHIYLN
jgi:hypothetical protein